MILKPLLTANTPINEVKWYVSELSDHYWPRQAALGCYGLMVEYGTKTALWTYRDKNPWLEPVIQEMIEVFHLDDPDTDPKDIYWWSEWTYFDPGRELSELEIQEILAKMPWMKVLPLFERWPELKVSQVKEVVAKLKQRAVTLA